MNRTTDSFARNSGNPNYIPLTIHSLKSKVQADELEPKCLSVDDLTSSIILWLRQALGNVFKQSEQTLKKVHEALHKTSPQLMGKMIKKISCDYNHIVLEVYGIGQTKKYVLTLEDFQAICS